MLSKAKELAAVAGEGAAVVGEATAPGAATV